MISREIEIKPDTNVEIVQDLAYGYAGEVWDAALVLSHFLVNKNKKHKFSDSFENKVILELGAGTGINGLVVAASLKPRKVYLTDKEENLGIIKKNYEINKVKGLIDSGTEVAILPLNWTKKEDWDVINGKIDIIICSDLVWNKDYFQPLIEVLDYFTVIDHTEVLLCYQYRQKSDIEFFNMLKSENKFTVERLPDEWLDEEYRSEDIFIVMIRKVGQK